MMVRFRLGHSGKYTGDSGNAQPGASARDTQRISSLLPVGSRPQSRIVGDYMVSHEATPLLR
jgi:hypothetical protein